MRCRICGAKLANENADVCLNCYKAYQEDEDLKKDVKERLVVKRKYKIAYIIIKYFEMMLIFILATLGCLASSKFLEAIFCVLIYIFIMVVILAWSKYIARNTKAVFYDKKVKYKSKNWFFTTEKIVKYSDIKNITVFKTHKQKKAGYGDICVYPGATILNGFQIKDVENVDEVVEKIKDITGILKK